MEYCSVIGKTVGFAGWWASWPAESVNGWIISDWITLNGYGHWSTKQEIITEHLTYPPSVVNELRPFNVNPVQPPLDEIRELAEFSAEEMSELEVAQQPMLGHPLSILKFGYCTQRANEEMALYMLKKHPPDLTGIFLIAVDQVSHTFWHYYEPWKYAGVDHEKAVRLGHVIPNIYVHDDQYIARLLQNVDSRTVVIIVSDHGFQATGVLPKSVSAPEFSQWFKDQLILKKRDNKVTIGQPGGHHIDGIFIASGGPIKKGITTTAQILV